MVGTMTVARRSGTTPSVVERPILPPVVHSAQVVPGRGSRSCVAVGTVRRSERSIVLEVVFQLGPDSALHTAAEGPDQRAEHPHPAFRVHLPVPAHHRALALGGKGQRPGGLHHRTGRARTKPVRPVERGQLHQHLCAGPAHACTEPRPQPDRQRCEQLDTSHGWVERRLVTRVGDRVKYLLGRRRDADMTGDVGHGSTVLGRYSRERMALPRPPGPCTRPAGVLPCRFSLSLRWHLDADSDRSQEAGASDGCINQRSGFCGARPMPAELPRRPCPR